MASCIAAAHSSPWQNHLGDGKIMMTSLL